VAGAKAGVPCRKCANRARGTCNLGRDAKKWAPVFRKKITRKQTLLESDAILSYRIRLQVGDVGARLSGGERKRLSLARAMLAARPWLLRDEPTEGLDPRTELMVRANLDKWLEETGTGLVLVTHRAALLPLATQRFAMPG